MNKNNEHNRDLDELFAAWQRYGERLDSTLATKPIEPAQIHFGNSRRSLKRRLTVSAVAVITTCIAAFVWMLSLSDRYVADTFDLIPMLVAGALLLYAVATSLSASTRADNASATVHANTAQVMTIIAIVAIAITTATPAYEGRSLSAGGDRTAAITTTRAILDYAI